ncbi:MAG: ABC transporter ATP-binding protein [Clostridia bacterium]|nr:ABC transporter ATP-binding protein [Clostridia bacterium]
MSSVTIKNLTKRYGEVQVLSEFNEVFRDGEFVTLLGPSGCGKTTMLRIIAGFEKPSTGEVWIDDQLVSGGKTFIPPERRDIGMVFQSYAVWPHMTVFDNVAYPLKIKHVAREEISRRVGHMLEVVHLKQYADRLPNQLSGGQQQRVALARALVAEPKLLLLDEPLSNLDAKLREYMRFEIKELTRSLGISVVYVTHDQTEAMAMSDRIFLINGGVVQQSGTPDEIYNRPVNPFVADFLGKVEFFGGTAEGGSIHVTDWNADLPDPDGSHRGAVDIAVRPENIRMSGEPGGIRGVLTRLYYLGDVCDCRVKVGESEVRVIADGHASRGFTPGDEVSLSVREFIVFEGGSAREQLKILT